MVPKQTVIASLQLFPSEETYLWALEALEHWFRIGHCYDAFEVFELAIQDNLPIAKRIASKIINGTLKAKAYLKIALEEPSRENFQNAYDAALATPYHDSPGLLLDTFNAHMEYNIEEAKQTALDLKDLHLSLIVAQIDPTLEHLELALDAMGEDRSSYVLIRAHINALFLLALNHNLEFAENLVKKIGARHVPPSLMQKLYDARPTEENSSSLQLSRVCPVREPLPRNLVPEATNLLSEYQSNPTQSTLYALICCLNSFDTFLLDEQQKKFYLNCRKEMDNSIQELAKNDLQTALLTIEPMIDVPTKIQAMVNIYSSSGNQEHLNQAIELAETGNNLDLFITITSTLLANQNYSDVIQVVNYVRENHLSQRPLSIIPKTDCDQFSLILIDALLGEHRYLEANYEVSQIP